MTRYYMHLRDGSDELLDSEGWLQFQSLEALRAGALLAVRDLMAADIRGGILDFRFRIDAEDESGQIVYTLPFEHALNIIPATVVPVPRLAQPSAVLRTSPG